MAQGWLNNVRLWIIVRSSRKLSANAAMHAAFPELPPDTDEFTGALIEASVQPPAYSEVPTYRATGVQLSETQRNALLGAIREQEFSIPESTLIAPGETPNAANDLWVFNGGTEQNDPGFWTYPQSYGALGLREAWGEET